MFHVTIFHRENCRRAAEIHAECRAGVSRAVFRQWQHHCCLAVAISDADWLVHSLNRGLSATVSDRCGRTPSVVFSKGTHLVDSTESLLGASRNLPFCSFPAKGSNRNNRRSVHFKRLTMLVSSGGKSLSEKRSARTSCTVWRSHSSSTSI